MRHRADHRFFAARAGGDNMESVAIKMNGMAMTNVAPLPDEHPRITGGSPRTDRVRWIVSIHIISIAVCLMFVLADRGLLVNEAVSRLCYPTSQLPWLLFCLPFFLCPLWLLVEIALRNVTLPSAVLGIIADTLLCMTQLQVLLPAVGEYAP